MGSRDGAVVRAMRPGLDSRNRRHMCVEFVEGSESALAQNGLPPGTAVFASPQKPTFPNFNSTLECMGIS